MVLDRRRKAFHYRHSVFLPFSGAMQGKNLQSVLSHLLKHKFKTIRDRCYYPDKKNIGDAVNDSLWPHFFVNSIDEEFSMLCLEVMYVEPGNSVPIIETEYDKSEIECEALLPPSASGDKSREFLDSIAYVAILENHVIFMQSKAIGIKDIEEYVNYLLGEAGIFADEKAGVLFQSANTGIPSLSLRQKSVKSVRLNLPLANGVSSLDVDDGIKLLETLVGEARLKELKKKIGIEISELKIDISFGYKYSTSNRNQELLALIAQGLLDSRDEDLEIELKGAGRIVGDEIQIKKYEGVEYSDSLPRKSDVYRIMANWLVDLLEQGIIEP